MNSSIILFGFPCAGKTTVGTRAARLLGWPFIDTDQEIEKAFQEEAEQYLSCREITQFYGMKFFLELEEKVLASLPIFTSTLISVGGAAVLREQNRTCLARYGQLVYLKTPLEDLIERNLRRVPLPTYLCPRDPRGSLEKIFAERLPLYQAAGDVVLDTGTLSIAAIADEIVKLGIKNGQ